MFGLLNQDTTTQSLFTPANNCILQKSTSLILIISINVVRVALTEEIDKALNKPRIQLTLQIL